MQDETEVVGMRCCRLPVCKALIQAVRLAHPNEWHLFNRRSMRGSGKEIVATSWQKGHRKINQDCRQTLHTAVIVAVICRNAKDKATFRNGSKIGVMADGNRCGYGGLRMS